MIAVVFSGSRFADWKLAEDDQIISNFRTVGLNPFFYDEKSIGTLLNKNNILINFAERIKRIYFYGAGAFSEQHKKVIKNAFSKFFRHGKVIVEHDINAVAIATCDDAPAIVAILSSGSNAAYFNGKKIKENNYGLGFILADEGASSWLGRRLLKNYLNGTLPKTIEEKFTQRYHLDHKTILDKVYRQPHPTVFLSSFVDFLLENKSEEYVKNLVLEGFDDFFRKYIIPLTRKYPNIPINFAGMVADGFKDYLQMTAEKYGLSINKVILDPILNVLNYYTNKN